MNSKKPKRGGKFQAAAPPEDSLRRSTRQRQVILQCLQQSKMHPTADELYVQVRRVLPHVSLGTVYRNLDVLCSQHQAIRLPGEQMRFDGGTHHHYHVRCDSCGAVRDVELSCRQNLASAVRGAGDFKVLGHHLEFIGRCGRCRKNSAGAR